jgi:hypothetical protein
LGRADPVVVLGIVKRAERAGRRRAARAGADRGADPEPALEDDRGNRAVRAAQPRQVPCHLDAADEAVR